MNIVVDTNIVFSAILNSSSNIGYLLINGSKYFRFISVNLLKEEISNHKGKIINLMKNEQQFNQAYSIIMNKINFIDEVFISDENLMSAYELTKDIDENDTLFIALAKQLNTLIWTGDKKLINGLIQNGYNNFITTNELLDIYKSSI